MAKPILIGLVLNIISITKNFGIPAINTTSGSTYLLNVRNNIIKTYWTLRDIEQWSWLSKYSKFRYANILVSKYRYKIGPT